MQFVEKFTYLGSVISKDNGAKIDITSRLSKARHAIILLTNIWISNKHSMKQKIETVKQQCKIYASLRFRVLEGGEGSKVSSIHNTCLDEKDMQDILAQPDFQCRTGLQDQ